MSEAKVKVSEGRDVQGRAVIDGKVLVDGRWVDGEIFDPNDFTVKQNGSDKESAKNAFDAHKEIPEVFRRAAISMIDALGAAGYDVEFRYKTDAKGGTAGITVTRHEEKADQPIATSPLAVATLPRTTAPGKDPHKDFRTAEERDAEARKHPVVA